MCGRYTFYNTKTIIEELRQIGKPLKDEVLPNFNTISISSPISLQAWLDPDFRDYDYLK